MRIYVTSVLVDDQAKALDFSTRVLGFTMKNDVPVGEHRWLTVVSPEDPGGTELLHEPGAHPAVPPYKTALVEDGIPATSFKVANLDSEHERLRSLGFSFTQKPMDAGPVRMAVLDDTSGNLIQLVQLNAD
ncbi:VOC family protein [Microvirga arabica]|uniref:VOC family protein n=1 Tax=Microvirga arabica TaxID=1128671 RepID=A0ABV6YAI2_9HYPH|nr:VOC family protein [Microvirga arabica]MBM1173767.1 VOC family protein [Microvirga arabica]